MVAGHCEVPASPPPAASRWAGARSPAARGGAQGRPEALLAATPADLLEFATIRGAEACGLGHLRPPTTSPASIVGAGRPAHVETVMVAGRIVEHEGPFVGVDLGDIRSRADQSRDRLFATPPTDA